MHLSDYDKLQSWGKIDVFYGRSQRIFRIRTQACTISAQMIELHTMKVYYQLYDPKNPTDKMRWPYRFGKVKHPSEKRISKVRGKKLADFNVLYAYVTIPFRIPSIFVLPPFLHTVIWYFFLPQYFRKIKLTRTPIKHVDHALDEKVPFRPDYVGKYMDFINIWIRPL